jgi:methionyl-tRNA formyltransferase
MRIDEGLDTGDMLLQREMPIAPEDTSVTLAPRLAAMGAELLVETLTALEAGTVEPIKQNVARATLAPILSREDGRVDFARDAQGICNRHRGFQPWPGSFSIFRGKQVTLHDISVAANSPALAAGELAIDGDILFAGCGAKSAIAIRELQLEGKRRMSAREFVNGYRPKPGEKLGS